MKYVITPFHILPLFKAIVNGKFVLLYKCIEKTALFVLIVHKNYLIYVIKKLSFYNESFFDIIF